LPPTTSSQVSRSATQLELHTVRALFRSKANEDIIANFTAENKGVFGDLILGGYDSSRFKSSGISFSFASSDARNLQVGVQSIVGSNTLLGVNSFTTKGGHLSLVDSSIPEMWLPREVCDSFQAALGLTYDDATGRYLVNDTIHSQLQSLNPKFTFKLGNTAYDNGNSTNIVLPYASFDQTIGYPVYSSSKNYFPIRRATDNSQYTVGRVLLQEAYLIVDYERKNFTLNQAVFSDPLPSPKIITIRSPGTDAGGSSSSLGTGAIAGIAVGGAVVLIAVAAFLWWFLRRRRQKADAEAAELDGKQKEGDAADGAAKFGKHHDPTAGFAEVSGDNQIAELGAPLEPGPGAFAKVRPESNVSELPAPAPVFEMAGDSSYYGDNTPQRSSRPTSTSKGPSPRPSPLSPGRESGVSPSPMASPGLNTNDTWYRQPSPGPSPR
jgi:Eukaryotic aspartyl protease